MKIVGTDKILRDLDRLSRVSRRAVVEEALLAGGEVVAEEARRLVPERTGNLRESIGVTFGQLNYTRGSVKFRSHQVLVGPRQGRMEPHDGFYGHMVEFGTEHSAPHPFMRPAFDIAGPRAADVVLEHLAAEWRNQAQGRP